MTDFDPPFVWTQADGMRSLPSVLSAAGIDSTAQWQQLLTAMAISANGRVLVGTGLRTDGVTREAYRATLGSVACPAP